jgi:hypothetical protein
MVSAPWAIEVRPGELLADEEELACRLSELR